jgi:predicted alpha/beta-hydrolase family hydrolase
MTEIVSDGRRDAASHLLFAHGAGAGMDSAFLVRLAKLLADAGLCVHRFEFAYMAARREGGSRRPPPRAEKLSGEYEAAVAQVAKSLDKGQRLFIGGKSMGGRVASLVADALWTNRTIAGLVCVGYPFHPVGQPAKLRTAHLQPLKCPALIVQGTRDPFGTRDEVEPTFRALPTRVDFEFVDGGDHGFAVPRSRGLSEADVLESVCERVAGWLRG